MVVGAPVMDTDAVTFGFTTAISTFEIAEGTEAQVELDVITTTILSPLFKVVVENVGELVPAGEELTNH